MSGAPSSLSGLVTALDNTKQMRVGENDHPEYDWNANDKMEELVQIFFQCVRTSDFATRHDLTVRFQRWVASVLTPGFYSGHTTLERRKEAIATALYGYKMVAQLRDIEEGKGECRLAYDFLYGWYEGVKQAAYTVAPGLLFRGAWRVAASLASSLYDLAFQTTTRLATRFMFNEGEDVQYGSFKDFKYICHEFSLLHLASNGQSSPAEVNSRFVGRTTISTKDASGRKTHRFRKGSETFRFTPELMDFLRSHPVISQLAAAYGARIMSDYQVITHGKTHTHDTTCDPTSSATTTATTPRISLAGKWAPRASSKLFAPLRTLLFASVVPESELWKETAHAKQNKESVKKAELKVDTVYRQRLSAINKALNTVQVSQCEKRWADIDFDRHVTSITLSKHKKAFARTTSLSAAATTSLPVDEDRQKCAENFKAFMERVRTGTSTAKGKCVSVTDFVKEALNLVSGDSTSPSSCDPKLLVDKQWEDKGKAISTLDDLIAMVDVSGSMSCDDYYPLHTAIGLGLRIAEKSRLGNRVLTFSESPSWVNLDDTPSFVERVAKVSRAPWGMNTNFRGALNLILAAARNANLSPEDVGKLTLVILSDMQMDHAGNHDKALFSSIAQDFHNTGISVCGRPYPVPKIVFWNLRTTKGFPTSSTDENAIMVSGGSDALLNDICENGLKALDKINPINTFLNILSKPRYASLDTELDDWMV